MTYESDDEVTSPLERALAIGATDLTQRALSANATRAYGREDELQTVFENLLGGHSLLLLGAADVGKTAVLHEAIYRIAHHQVPEALRSKHVISISCSGVLAGTRYLGEWQTRLTSLLDAVKADRNLLLYLEDIWAIRDAGRASDKADGFSTVIRPYLERQEILLIGECTPENFTASGFGARALADEPSFMKHLTVVQLNEPVKETTRSILAAVARDLQRTHKVRIEATAIDRAFELSRRFQPYQAFPGKATRLLQQAAQECAKSRQYPGSASQPSGSEAVVTPDLLSATFSHVTGLPEKIISDTIPLTQEEIRAYFDERIVGQDEAVSTIVDVVTLVKAELNDPGRPMGVLFFVGPTGVGKTELAKTLAEYLFGSKERLIRLDMSEYKTIVSHADLLQQLTEKVRRQSFSVLLLDEIEKASPVVFDLFLQVFDDGRLTDASGRSVNLHNTIIILTSNIGNQLIENRSSIGFIESNDNAGERSQGVIHAVESYFRPEFINRLDKIVVFQPLGLNEMRTIARRELGKALLREGVLRRNILLDFREEVLDVLLKAGFSASYGARPLQRAIRELVLLPLARRIAAAPSAGEQLLELCVRDGRIDTAVIPLAIPPEAQREEAAEPPTEMRERLSVVEAGSGRMRMMDLRLLQQSIAAQHERIEAHIASARYQALQTQAQQLLEEAAKPSFWDDQERSRQLLSIIYHAERITDRFNDLRSRAEGLMEVAEMIRRHNDTAGLPKLASSFAQLERDVALAELELFTGDDEMEGADAAFIAISPVVVPRAGHPEGWPEQLAAMYAGWARLKGYEIEAIGEIEGQPLLALRGPNLGRILAGEEGIHKLQREPEGAREHGHRGAGAHMQFARVEVFPVPRKDAYPFSVESVRVTPVIDGQTVEAKGRPPYLIEATEERSGLRVRLRAERGEEVALALLAARLTRQLTNTPPSDTVVRIYHLARTQYVRDPRTGQRSGRPRDVLAGALDDFLLAYLKQQTDATPSEGDT